MDWYLAPSLAVLRAEINARWPHRDHASDGTIGNAAHQATRSDHNPNSRGSVDAIDIDGDGIDFPAIFAAIRKHPSSRYVIYRRALYHRLRGWRPEPYTGPSPHEEHFHLSIDQTVAAESDRRPWGLLEDEMSADAERQIAELHNAFLGATSGPFTNGDGKEVSRVTGYDDAAFALVKGNVPNTWIGRTLADVATRVAALETAPEIDYDKLAQALLRAVLTR